MKASASLLISYAVLWLAFVVAGREKLFNDDDTYWHLAVGRDILASGQFITQDSYSCTFNGQRWIAHQWLGECGMALVHRFGGWDGLLLVTTAGLAAVYAWITSRFLSAGLNPVMTALIMTIGLAVSTGNMLIRPHMVTLSLLGVVFGILSAVDTRRLHPVTLWWLPPIFLVWSNTHGGALGGIGTVGIVFGGWVISAWFRLPTSFENPADVRQLFWIGPLCCLTTVLTPYGTGTFEAWRMIMGADLPELVVEHAPMNLSRPESVIVLLLAMLWLVVAATSRRYMITMIIPVVWFLLCVSRIRHAPLFGVVALISLTDLLPRSKVSDWLAGRDFFRLPVSSVISRNRWSPVVIVTAMVWIGCIAIQNHGSTAGPLLTWARPKPSKWPVELLSALQKYAASSTPINILNDEELAGFLIYNCRQYKVFFDSRCELYGDEFIRDYVRSQAQTDLVAAWIEKYHLTAALVTHGTPLQKSLTKLPGWELQSSDATTEFWVRSRGNTD